MPAILNPLPGYIHTQLLPPISVTSLRKKLTMRCPVFPPRHKPCSTPLSLCLPTYHDKTHLCPRHDTPGTNDVVSVTSEQSLAISRPGQADTLGLPALLANRGELGLELVNLALLLKVEDDDAAGGGSAEPVSVGGEDEGVDLVVGVEGVQVLGLVEVPEHGGTVLATGGAERAIGGDGDGVDVAGVADVVGLQLAAGQLPNLLDIAC